MHKNNGSIEIMYWYLVWYKDTQSCLYRTVVQPVLCCRSKAWTI